MHPEIFRTTLTRREAEVKVKKESTENEFNHIGRQESSGTRIFTVAEVQCVRVGRRELMFVCVSFSLPHSIVAETVEDLRIWYAWVFLLV